MAKSNFLPILLTVGLLAVGGGAYYFATKKEGGGDIKIPTMDEIIAYITGLFGGGGGGNGGNGNGDGNGDGDGDGCVKKTCSSTQEWNQSQCKCVNKGDGTKPCVKKTCSSSQIWSQSQCKCVSKTPPPPPPPGTGTGSAVLGAAGDWGSGRNSNWKKVTAVMKSQKISTAIGLGDYSYTSGGDWKPVVDDLKKAEIMFKGVEGNHDGSGYAGVTTGTATFNIGPVCVILLNTENGVSGNVSFAEKTLKATTKPWKILAMHKPPYTNDSDHGGEKSLASALKPLINKYGVQVVFAAHNHNYQRIVKSDQPKCVFIVAGTGGESHYDLKASEAGTKKMDDSNYGFTKLTISGSTLKGQFISTGNKVLDSWTQTLSTTKSNYVYAYQTMEARISA